MFHQYLVFNMKGCWILSNAFLHWDDHVCFVSGSVYVMDYVYWFAFVEPALHPRDEANLIVVDKLFDVLLDSICQYFIEDFYINVHQKYCPEVFFSCCVSARFWYQDDASIIKWVREESLLFNCLECFRRNPPASFCTSGRIYLWILLVLGFFWLVGY